VDPFGLLAVGPIEKVGQLGEVTVRADAGPDWSALWELWWWSLQMSGAGGHGLLLDGPELLGGGGGGGGAATVSEISANPPQRKSDFPCPPSEDEIINNPGFRAAIQRANEVARADQSRGFVEVGGWVLMDRRGNLRWQIKTPEARDTSTMVYCLGEPEKYIRGHGRREIVVADFHTHVNEIPNPDEIPIANARRVPGIWIYPSGRAERYGPKRGLFGRNLPRGCQ